MSDPTAPPAFPPVDYATWRARVAAELGGEEAVRRLERETLEGIRVEPLYAADHLAAGAPLPRAARESGPWRIWQEVPARGGARVRAALRGERARELAGVWLRVEHEDTTAADLAALLADVPASVELAVEGAGEPLALAALLAGAMGEERLREARGCLGADPSAALARTGTLSAGAEQLVAVARWAAAHAPQMRAGLVSTAPYADAGADARQEIAFALATLAESLRALTGAGFEATQAARQLLVSVTVGRDLYLQVAKLRALRLTASMLLAGGGADPAALRLHARSAWRSKTTHDPGTDLVRVTLEALAAVLAGADDVTCAPFADGQLEQALGLPLASATQLLLRDEALLAAIDDPLAGSHYVESLTATLAREAWSLYAGIEARGGMMRELAVGAVALQVEEAAERRRAAIAAGALPIVGVTVHPPQRPAPLPHRPTDAGAEAPRRAGAAAVAPPIVAPPGSPEAMASAVALARGGASLAQLAAAMPRDGQPLRAPAQRPWRDAEAAQVEVPA